MMGKVILILVIFIIIVLVVNAVRLARRKRAFKVVQHNSKRLIDKGLSIFLKSELNMDEVAQKQILNSAEAVSDVWGVGVTVFSYEFMYLNPASLKSISKKITDIFNEYATKNNLHGIQGKPAFYITDIWLKDNYLHIDIAHLTNQVTVNYINDINKV